VIATSSIPIGAGSSRACAWRVGTEDPTPRLLTEAEEGSPMPKGSSALRRHAEEQPARLAHPVAEEAVRGLTKERKTLPPKLFYDDEGCRLFASITELPEYYVTRTELALLRERSAE